MLPPPSPPPELLAAVAEAAYLAALNASLSGDNCAANALLALLGCRWRLSRAVWAAAAATATAAPAAATAAAGTGRPRSPLLPPPSPVLPPPGTAVLVHDSPLTDDIMHSLCVAFGPGSDYWEQHAYGAPDTPFHSYLLELHSGGGCGIGGSDAAAGTCGGSCGTTPRSALHAAALALQTAAAAVQQQQPPPLACCSTASAAAAAAAAVATHVEVWAHTRTACSPHQLHVDVAEAALRRGLSAYRLVHPAASSVLFLGHCPGAGPTLVLDQTAAARIGASADDGQCGSSSSSGGGGGGAQQHVDSTAGGGDSAEGQLVPRSLASCGWLLPPAAGRFGLWPGNLVHGVLPGAPLPLTADPTAGGPLAPCGDDVAGLRTTLIFAWWSGCPTPTDLDQVDQQEQQQDDGGGGLDKGCAGRQAALRPCMPFPVHSNARWLQALQHGAHTCDHHIMSSSSSSSSSWYELHPVSPAWESVDTAAATAAAATAPLPPHVLEGIPATLLADPGVATAPLPPLRFFLRDADELRRAYVPAQADH